MARILSKAQLEGFEKYKYNSIDTSVLSNYVMHPFWNWCVQFCPAWVAPNLLTFTGFLLTVINFLLFSYYDYGFHALTKENVTNDHIPSWVWGVTAVNLFVAYTLGERTLLRAERIEVKEVHILSAPKESTPFALLHVNCDGS